MAPKLVSCDVFGMLLKYGRSTEGVFGGGEKLNLVKCYWAAFPPSACDWW